MAATAAANGRFGHLALFYHGRGEYLAALCAFVAAARARGFGWSLHEPNVKVMYRSPVDIYIDEWACNLMDAVERTKARRVLIDSLADRGYRPVMRYVPRIRLLDRATLLPARRQHPDDFGDPAPVRRDRISDFAFSPSLTT